MMTNAEFATNLVLLGFALEKTLNHLSFYSHSNIQVFRIAANHINVWNGTERSRFTSKEKALEFIVATLQESKP